MTNVPIQPGSAGSTRLSAGLLFFLLLIPVALVSGALVGLGMKILNVLMFGGLAGLFLLGVPTRYTVWILLVLVYFIVGQVIYFGRLSAMLWVPYGIGLLLYLKLPSLMARGKEQQLAARIPIAWIVVAFFLVVLISTAVNTPNPLQVVAGGKNLVGLWSIYFVVALGALSLTTLRNIWRFLILVAAFQVPLVLYQYFIVAPSRTAFGATEGASWDSVVGGFGGDPMGGGASGSLALFLCIVLLFGIALYRRSLIPLKWFIALTVILIGCISLAEVKVVAVLIPAGLTVLFWSSLRSRPVLAVSLVPISLLGVLGILMAYDTLHYGTGGRYAHGPAEVVERAFSYSLDPNQINFKTWQMGRAAALKHWWHENIGVDPLRSFIGHGPGASRGRSILGVGEAARKYPFFIDRSSATQLLWDVGLLGFLLVCVALLRGAWTALVCSRVRSCPPELSASLEATAAALVMMVVMLPYSRDLLEVPATGVLMMLLLGYAAFAHRSYAREIGVRETRHGRLRPALAKTDAVTVRGGKMQRG